MPMLSRDPGEPAESRVRVETVRCFGAALIRQLDDERARLLVVIDAVTGEEVVLLQDWLGESRSD